MDVRMLIDGRFREGAEWREARSPYSGEAVSRFPLAGEQEIEDALASSLRGFEAMRRIPSHERAALLLRMRDGLDRARREMERQIALEAGKPMADSRTEVSRALNVLTLAAEEAKRIHGETLPLDLMPGSQGRWGLTRRFPIGPVIGISPFNFPLNLGMHKVAPALAAGCSVIWKPSLLTPGPALIFAQIAAESGLPAGALNVVTPPDSLAEKLVTDDRPRMLSFTGSARVGWMLRAKAGRKKVVLELGGNAAVLVASDADLDHAVQRCVSGGFTYAGQVCISTQRIFVETPLYDAFVERLVPAVRALPCGDPLDESVRMGPLINEKEASRLEGWIQEAVSGGARILTGGTRRGLMFEPTVLVDTKPEMSISCEEAFGPVVTVTPVDSWQEALTQANDSRYGLQAGVFTQSLPKALAALESLEAGGIIVNDVPSYRMDSMPYGGVKESGLGREGLRYAIEAMTEVRLMAFA